MNTTPSSLQLFELRCLYEPAVKLPDGRIFSYRENAYRFLRDIDHAIALIYNDRYDRKRKIIKSQRR